MLKRISLLALLLCGCDAGPHPDRFTWEAYGTGTYVITDSYTCRQYLVITNGGIVELDPVPQVEVEER